MSTLLLLYATEPISSLRLHTLATPEYGPGSLELKLLHATANSLPLLQMFLQLLFMNKSRKGEPIHKIWAPSENKSARAHALRKTATMTRRKACKVGYSDVYVTLPYNKYVQLSNQLPIL